MTTLWQVGNLTLRRIDMATKDSARSSGSPAGHTLTQLFGISLRLAARSPPT